MIKLETLKKTSLANLKKKAEKLDCPIDLETANRSELIQFIFDDQQIEEEIEEEIEAVDESQQESSGALISLEKAESKSLASLRHSVSKADIKYIPDVAFPMYHTPEDGNPVRFTFASGHVFNFTTTAIYFLRYINRNEIKYAELSEMIEAEDYGSIADLTNHEKFSKKLYIAAEWHGMAVGFLANYNQVDTIDLINMIVDNGLGKNVEYTYHDTTKSIMRINVRPADKGVVKSFAVIKNGHQGQVSLSYFSGVRINDFLMQWKFKGESRRHLSKINQAVESLSSVIEKASSIKFNAKLEMMTVEDVLAAMTGKDLVDNEKFIEICNSVRLEVTFGHWDEDDGILVTMWVADKANDHGYKSVINKALENLFNGML